MEIDEIIARAKEENEREKKIGWYVAMVIVGKAVLILVIWVLYVMFVKKHFEPAFDSDNSGETKTTITILNR